MKMDVYIGVQVLKVVSAPCLRSLFKFPVSFLLEIPLESTETVAHGTRSSTPCFADGQTEARGSETTSPGLLGGTTAEPRWERGSSDFQLLYLFLNYIHFLNICVVKVSFVESDCNLDGTMSL